MQYRQYQNFDEKRRALEDCLNAWPPTMKIPGVLEVSHGRCGSNELHRIVDSFYEGVDGKPGFQLLDQEQDPPLTVDYWQIPETTRYYFFSVFDRDIHRLQYPVLLWMLQQCQKVVYLNREDHLMRALSLMYADRVAAEARDAEPMPDSIIYTEPVCVTKLDNRIFESCLETELIKLLVTQFVPASQLFHIRHHALYHASTMQTLRELVAFLGAPQITDVSLGVYKTLQVAQIVNADEICERYNRKLIELPFWLPEDLRDEAFVKEVTDAYQNLLLANLPEEQALAFISQLETQPSLGVEEKEPERERKTFTIKLSQGISRRFDIPKDARFYLDAIPSTATWVAEEEFMGLPSPESYLQMLDDRWETLSTADDAIPSCYNDLLRVADIQSNRVGEYEWVCGFSVFFLKDSGMSDYTVLPDAHNRLLEGVDALSSYDERCPKTLLRFYVSKEVWERLAKTGVLYRPHTEFYQMAYPSEETQLGVIWRFLCLSDTDFEWAIQADCAPDEDWVFSRIAHWSRAEFKQWLSVDEFSTREFPIAGEYLFFDGNWKMGNLKFKEYVDSIFCRVDYHDFLSGGGVVTRPKKMPDIEKLILRYLYERSRPNVFYHAAADKWTSMWVHARQIPHGWEGFGYDQGFWRYLKKALPMRHEIHAQSLAFLRLETLPDDYLTKRIVSQLIAEGSEFVHIHTHEPVFNLIG